AGSTTALSSRPTSVTFRANSRAASTSYTAAWPTITTLIRPPQPQVSSAPCERAASIASSTLAPPGSTPSALRSGGSPTLAGSVGNARGVSIVVRDGRLRADVL